MKSKQHRRISCLLILLLCVSLLQPVIAQAAENSGTRHSSREEIHIRTAEEFLDFAQKCSLDAWSWDKTVYLEEDIALDGIDFQPIATFGGMFNGQRHTISGVTLESSFAPTGLFRVLQEQGIIQNLYLSVTAAPAGEVQNIGGIAGVNHGTIQHCSVTSRITGKVNTGGIAGINSETGSIRFCTSEGRITGKSMTGGIAGCNNGIIYSCSNAAFVNNEASDTAFNLSDLDLDFSLDMKNISALRAQSSPTDSGGIAGYSSGQIQRSKNTGVVGYPHVGYNAGGIVGRSCGYLFDCSNSGYICGRKDIGGIAGQLEPEVETILSEDYLETLSQQFDNLSQLVDRTGNHAAGAGYSIQNCFQNMRGHMSAAQEAVGDLFPTSIEDILAGPNMAALDTIRYSIAGMGEAAKDIGSSIGNAAGTLGSDMAGITGQIEAIADTFSLATEDLKKEVITDTSLEQLEEIVQGKVLLCSNTASVYGDINTGGIAGNMSVESGTDPEDDLSPDVPTGQRRRYQLKTIVQSCTNTGNIKGKRSYVGSICGRMDLGLITDCEGYGQIESESGNYTGGIAGQTCGTIQNCFSKCILSGGKYVGGIVGSGLEEAANGSFSTVTNCYSMVEIDRCDQYAGAISGGNAGSFLGNFFVSSTLAGIDHTSYVGKAQPLSYGDLLSLETAASIGSDETAADDGEGTADGGEGTAEHFSPKICLPDAFKHLSIRFVADDTVIHTETVNYGESISLEDFPDIPHKDGYSARWDQDSLEKLQFDTVVTAEYTQYIMALPSYEKRENDRSIFFVSGEFAPEDTLTVTPQPLVPAEFDLLPKNTWDRIGKCFTGRVLYRDLMEQWHIEFPDDGLPRHTIRYLPPEESRVAVFLKQDDGWVPVDTETVGSYLAFDCTESKIQMAVVSYLPVWWVWVLAAALIAASAGGIFLFVRRKQKSRAKAAEKTPEQEPVSQPSQDPPKGKKKRWGRWLVLVAVLIVLLCIGLWFFLRSDVKTSLDAYQLIAQYVSQDRLAMELSVTGEAGDRQLSFGAQMEKLSQKEPSVTVIRQDPVVLYYADNTVYLENGKAFRLSSSHPDYSSLLDYAAKIFRKTHITETDGVYTITVQGADAMEILKTLMPSEVGSLSDIHAITVSLVAQENTLSSISFHSEGILAEKETPYRLQAVLNVIKPDSELALPDSVKRAMQQKSEGVIALTDELIALGQGWLDLNSRSLIGADITLAADCGPLVISEDLTFHQQKGEDITIGCLQKKNYSIYFTDQKLCDSSGTAISIAQQPLAQSAKLLDIAYELSMNAAHSFSSNCYTIKLDEKNMESVVYTIAPDAAELPIRLAQGTLKVYLSDGAISRIAISCSGSMEIMVAEVNVSVSANIQLREPDAAFSIPEKVYSALRR